MDAQQDDCKHCWHSTGVALPTWPMQYEEACCHCAATRYIRDELPVESGEHGPHKPNPYRIGQQLDSKEG